VDIDPVILIIAVLAFLFGWFLGNSAKQMGGSSVVLTPREDTLESYLSTHYPNAS
jgi:hypothetical protein